METNTTASLPTYTEAASDADQDLLQPVALVLDGQSIHAESDPTVHLYVVNRGIAHLGPATSVVEFARMEQRAGIAKQRHKQIYNLHSEQQSSQSLPSPRQADYFIEAVAAPSRRLGHLGLKKAGVLADHWTVLPVDLKGWTHLSRPPYVADATPVFEARHRQGAWKWTDGDGHDVAVEYDSDQEHRLLVTASLQRETLDALVALRCCRVWRQSVQQTPTVKTTSIRDTLRHGREVVDTRLF
jgi:hypothetical protein